MKHHVSSISIIGFWAWIIVIQNNPNGMDLIDAAIIYLTK